MEINNTGNAILISALTAIIVYCTQFQIKLHWILLIVIALGYILAFYTYLGKTLSKEVETLLKEQIKLELEKTRLEIANIKREQEKNRR
jgi:cell division protein FtsW (lipid II flippase)